MFISRVCHYTFVVALLFLSCFSDYKHEFDSKTSCPVNRASFLSQITFSWFTSLAWKGLKRPLVQDDMWKLNHENQTKNIYRHFNRYWKPAVDKNRQASQKKLNVIWPLCKTFWQPMIVVIAFKFVASFMTFVNPLILDQLITFMSSDQPNWIGLLYAFGMFGSACLESILNNQYEYLIFVLSMRVRSALTLTIYKKALVLSSSGRKDFTTGQIVNLMSVDVQKVMEYVQMMNLVWASVLQIAIGLYFLWLQLNLATLAGIGVMILMMPVNAVITKKLKESQTQLMKDKDGRTKLLNEILNGIKVLKLYAWEVPFAEKINYFRNKELVNLRKLMIIFSIILFVFNSAPFFVSMASFAVYVLMDPNNVLDANKAFVSLTLFNILRVPLGLVPFLISNGVMCLVSIRRINKYLSGDELDLDAISKHEKSKNPIAIQMKQATFTWGNETESDDNSNILKEINLKIPRGQLVAVVGTVGAGKSSLLSAILGDMLKRSGEVSVNGRIAYVPQQAWIQNATVRDNILFSAPFVERRYEDVLKRSQLLPDLRLLQAGDLTEIGEKGINLSGGQKQRVSIARSLYADADIYLFDDPLSALDSQVGRQVFEQAISNQGMLRGRTRVLVTHRIALLPQVDQIVVLNNGQIAECGSYSELLAAEGEFAQFIAQYLCENDSDVSSEVEADELKVLNELKQKVQPKLEQLQQSLSTSVEQSRRRESMRASRLQRSESMQIEQRQRKQVSQSVNASPAGTPKSKPAAGRITEQEHVEIGSVKWSVYMDYIKALGVSMLILTLVSYFLSHSFNVFSSLWLSAWSDDALDDKRRTDKGVRDMRLIGYAAFGLGEAVFVLFATLTLNLACLAASKYLHNEMLNHIMDSPLRFFDCTPLGRILNRFSKDIDTADFGICINVRGVLVYTFRALVSFLLISLETPLFLLSLIPLGIFYWTLQKLYIASSRQLKRIESTSRSPVYSHFQETVAGAASIRAYGSSARFERECCNRLDINHEAYYPSVAALRWLTVRLELLGYTIVCLAALFAVFQRHALSAGLAGVSISSALTITATLNMLVRSCSDLETNIVAIERCLEYTRLDSETLPTQLTPIAPPPDWPSSGTIRFEKYSTKYRSDLPDVLHDLSFEVQPGEKIGIVGRTGAGKSSLTLALFRVIEASSGRICIGELPINRLSLNDLRSRLSIIPQEPVLFGGTLRANLDPHNKLSDEDIWQALQQAHLKEFVSGCSGGLDFLIGEGGDNLSVGQRQLICLARALLRKSKILVLDEATAAVDVETDELIQKTIRREFASCTILTIAHRLHTILDYDRVLVLQHGRLGEYNSPRSLLQDENSLFFSMARDANII